MIMHGVLNEKIFLIHLANFGTPQPSSGALEGTYFLASSIEIEENYWGKLF